MKTFRMLLKWLPIWMLYFSTMIQVLKCDFNSDEKDSKNILQQEQLEAEQIHGGHVGFCADGEFKRICIPKDYMKYELPTDEGATDVSIGVDIKDIPKVNDKDFSITLNAYFIAKWLDKRLEITWRNRTTRGHINQKPRNEGLFEKDKNVINFESKFSTSTTVKVCY